MSTLLWIIGATLIVSAISFVGVSALSLRRDFLKKILTVLVAFSAGTLIAVSLLDILPEALEMEKDLASLYVIAGILIFFVVERFVGWHSGHHAEDIDPQGHKIHHHDHAKPFVYINLISDAVHNFIDGTLIAASFIVSIPLGIASTIAIAFHEIPQEIGDFALLIHGGLSIKKALFYNFIVAVTAIVGGIVTFFVSSTIQNLTPILLGIAGGGFLYIALVDLLPEIHGGEKSLKKSIIEFVFLVIGILVMYLIGILMPH